MAQADNIDSTHLLALARDRSDASRGELFAIIGDLFHDKDAILTAQERAIMTDILRKLIGEVERSVRRTLALKLADAPGLPREVAVLLANEDIDIASPILMRSPVIEDLDLIEIIRRRSLEHALAVAMRRDLSTTVTDVLVETGNSDVIRLLLENQTARISDATLAYLVEQSRSVDEFQEPLVRRQDLPPELARRLVMWVSAALRSSLISRFSIDPDVLDDHLEPVARDEAQVSAAQGETESAAEFLSRSLGKTKQLTPRLLLQTLRRGEIQLFEAMMAEMGGLRLDLVRRIIYEPGGQALALASRGIGLNREEFAAIFMLTRKSKPNQASLTPAETNKALEFFDRLSHTAAETVLQRWRRDPDYLFAIRSLEEGRDKRPA
jgi:uncharacterized protein (DUF2336 family)